MSLLTNTAPSPRTDSTILTVLDLPALLAEVCTGDRIAFTELYELTHVQLEKTVAHTMRAPDHVGEVLQEVYLYVWGNAGSYDPGRGTVLGWLSMLSYRRAVDRIRAVTRSVARDHRSSLESAARVMPDIADLSIARHEAGCLHRALAQLSGKQRDAVTLTYLGGYTHQEAAELLKVPLGTLKTRVRDGMSSLRLQLVALTPER